MLRLVQIQHSQRGRGIAVVEDGRLRLLKSHRSIYALACAAIERGDRLVAAAADDRGDETLDYDLVYEGSDEWSILPAFDHPDDPARCLVSGTGLTHTASAKSRQAMHGGGVDAADEPVTDSMRMFQWGVAGGKPPADQFGVQPEWFYKGNGTILCGHGQPLEVPPFADDGGEEPEVAGAYLIDQSGAVWRVGLAIGNEFADHQMERKNYLYLAPSKLRSGAIGPELIVGGAFGDVRGEVRIERDRRTVWRQSISTGEANMSHSLANLEHHQFKYAQHRRPGDAHVHYYGADAFSFGAGVRLADGDVMVVEWSGLGRSLRNPVRIDSRQPQPVAVRQL